MSGSRHLARAGQRGFEPGITREALEVRESLIAQRPAEKPDGSSRFKSDPVARPDDLVLDCILVEPRHWWLGYHQATGITSRYPGGFIDIGRPSATISRVI